MGRTERQRRLPVPRREAGPGEGEAERAGVSELVVRLQRGPGNRQVARLISRAAIQRQPAPEVGGACDLEPEAWGTDEEGVCRLSDEEADALARVCRAPELPPQVAGRLIAVRTTLSKVPPLSPRDQATMERVIPGAPILGLIRERNTLQEGIATTQQQIASLMPSGGQPEESAQHEIFELTRFLEGKREELERLQTMIGAVVQGTGASDESELARLVEKDFPQMFLERGKTIAIRQLDDNREIAVAEAARFGGRLTEPGTIDEEIYGGGQTLVADRPPNAEDARGLRQAAGELLPLRRAREEAERQSLEFHSGEMEDEYERLQAGVPDPTPILQRAQAAEAEAMARLGPRFPILYRADLEAIVGASDAELPGMVQKQIAEVLENIERTRANIENGKLEVWNLRGIVDLTAVDLGIPEGSPLMEVVEGYVRDAKADESLVDMAISALAITAGLVATFATGGVALVAGVIAVGASGYQLAESVDRYMVESAASNVALDPELADISVNEPEIMPIITGIVSLGLDAAALGKAIIALRGPARALLAEGDIVAFAEAARAALPPAAAEQLIFRAARIPEVGTAVERAVKAVGNAFRRRDLNQVTALLDKVAERGYADLFDDLVRLDRVHPLTPEAVRGLPGFGEEAVQKMTAEGLFSRPALYEPRSEILLLAPGMNREALSSYVVHEVTHHLVGKFGKGVGEFEEEFMAWKLQRDYLDRLLSTVGPDALPRGAAGLGLRGLAGADDARIAEQIAIEYPEFVNPGTIDGKAAVREVLTMLAKIAE
jgi:hypothetical protein